jgi:hypothetical protein
MLSTTAYTTAAPTYTKYNATFSGYKITLAPSPFPKKHKDGPMDTVGMTLPMSLSGLTLLVVVGVVVWAVFFMKREPGFGLEEEEENVGVKEEEEGMKMVC